MEQTNLYKTFLRTCVLMTAFLSCCYSSVDPTSGQPQISDSDAKGDAVGKKLSVASGKSWGKFISKGKSHQVTVATGDPSQPISVATTGKQAVQKDVARAILDLAAESTEPLRVTIDANRGTLRRFSGKAENLHGNSTRGAVSYLEENLSQYGLSASEPVTLKVAREIVDEDGARHVVTTPEVGDLPVWLTTAAIHLDAEGNVRAVNAENLASLHVTSAVRFDSAAAIQAATRANLPLSADGEVHTVSPPELGILPPVGTGGSAAYAWKLVQQITEPDNTPQYFETYINAATGEVMERFATTASDSLIAATGTLPQNNLGNPESLRVSYSAEANTYVLFDQSRGTASGEIYTYNANNEYSLTLTNSTLVSSGNKDSWDVIGGSTHANLQKTVDYYLTTHGRNSWDGRGAPVRGIVHYGQSYVNAYWTPYEERLVFGDGDGSQYMAFGGALDVVAHEFSHAVVSATASLVYENQSGALNESFADVMSVMVDREDWIQGEDIMGPYASQSAIRSLADPNLYGHPATMDEYRDISWDHGGVHINCGIPSHAAYLVGSSQGREVTEKVWYRTLNQGHVGPYANFRDMAEGTLVACSELVEKGSLTRNNCTGVANAWVEVGVLEEAGTAGCAENSTARDGLCYCNQGFAPSLTSSECVEVGTLDCPAHSIETNGQCFCEDGYRVPPSDDTAAPMTCELEENACPANSSWDAATGQCVCNEGFEGNPDGLDGGCTVIASDCPQNSHPEWSGNRADTPDEYACVCNDGFQYDAADTEAGCVVEPGGCGNESFYGRCDGTTLIYCGPDDIGTNEIKTVDCGGAGLSCGLFDSRIGFDCLNPAGLAEGAACDANDYQECGAGNPFCVAEEAAATGFCSKECKVNEDCGNVFACCGTVSDGTRACLTTPYCDNVLNIKATCDDVVGGSAYYGSCDGNVLVYCDGSTATTQSVNCPKLGQVCRFVDEETGYNCIDDGAAGAISAPVDWCPYENDGVCDVPANCPEGSDLFDCNPCGAVTASGQCESQVLQLCDPTLGLVTTNCATLPATPLCGVGTDGVAACVAAPDTDSDSSVDTASDTTADSETATDTATDSATTDTASADTDTGAPPKDNKKSVSCGCSAVGSSFGALFSLLNLLF